MTPNGTPYTPRPTSKGALALEHLKAFGQTSAMDLADAIDVHAKNLQNNIVLTLNHGLIVKRMVEGRAFYDVGDGTPPVEEAEQESAPTPVFLEGAKASEPDEATETPADVIQSALAPVVAQRGRSANIGDWPARTEQKTPPKGSNRDASAGQSHDAGESASSARPRPTGASARGADPAFIHTGKCVALCSSGRIAVEAEDGHVIVFEGEAAARVGAFLARMGGAA